MTFHAKQHPERLRGAVLLCAKRERQVKERSFPCKADSRFSSKALLVTEFSLRLGTFAQNENRLRTDAVVLHGIRGGVAIH